MNGAKLLTAEAADTFVRMNHGFFFALFVSYDFDGMYRAGTFAFAASDTLMGKVRKLWLGFQALGIVTPYATKRASLEEHGRPYSVAVVDGKAFYFKYRCGHFFHIEASF